MFGTLPKPYKKVVVALRCIFLKVSQVDTVNENYYADIYIQAKWREPQLDNKTDAKTTDLSTFWNPKLFVENVFGDYKESVSMEVFFPDKKKTAYIVEKRRVKGTFHETLELKQFPFDCQDLSVSVSSEYSSDDVDLIESPDDISKLNAADSADSQEWNLHNHVEISRRTVTSDFDVGVSKRQVLEFTCRASRRFGYFLINHLLISVMLCMLAFCSFAVNPKSTHGRLQLCMIILLTTVTFKVVVSQNLPKISYLTYLDKAVLGNLFVIMCLCIWHASISVTFHDSVSDSEMNSEGNQIKYIRDLERIVIPCLFGLYVLTMLVFGCIIYFDAGSRRRMMQKKDIEFQNRNGNSNSVQDPCCDPF